MNKKTVSIIVPIYNVEKYLDECINSIVNQTYKNCEIILVDDGSTDSSSQICDQWAIKDSRIKVIHKSNGGQSEARNVGIDTSTGEYIMFVDSDDFIEEDTVSNLENLIEQTNADIACGGFYKFKSGKCVEIHNTIIESENVIFSGIVSQKNILRSLTDVSSCCKLYKKNIIGELRFATGRQNEDILFLFLLYHTCKNIVYTKRRLYYYRDTPGSTTNRLSKGTMDVLHNLDDMKRFALDHSLPISQEMENYDCRTHLELGYAIQRDRAKSEFPIESARAKKNVKNHILYMIKHPDYNWRDLAHAIIILFRL